METGKAAKALGAWIRQKSGFEGGDGLAVPSLGAFVLSWDSCESCTSADNFQTVFIDDRATADQFYLRTTSGNIDILPLDAREKIGSCASGLKESAQCRLVAWSKKYCAPELADRMKNALMGFALIETETGALNRATVIVKRVNFLSMDVAKAEYEAIGKGKSLPENLPKDLFMCSVDFVLNTISPCSKTFAIC